MKVLLDAGVSPRLRIPLGTALGNVPVETARHRGWDALQDEELLERGASEGFTVLVTTDKSLGTEQPDSPLAVVAVDDNRVPALLAAVAEIAEAIRSAFPGQPQIVATRSRLWTFRS